MFARVVAFALIAVLAPVAAPAAPPSPAPSTAASRKVPLTLSNPGASKNQPTMNGQGCIANRTNANQTSINPITGKKQAAPIVSIPLGAGSGSVASATNRASQTHNCANARN